MKVVCLEGCHGVGKTSVIERLRKQHDVQEEFFMDVQPNRLDPQSFFNEITWCTNWFQAIIKRANAGCKLLFCDRSPYSAAVYAKANGELVTQVCQRMIEELKQVDVQFIMVRVSVPRDELWKRILKRLEQFPERKRYGEHVRTWMDNTEDWYDRHEKLWDYTVQNDSVDQTCVFMEKQVGNK